MSHFIVETRRRGEPVWYISKPPVAGNQYALTGYREGAHKFTTRAMAQVASRRFSSAYNMIVREIE